jgi:hypothetical protein
MTYTDATIAFDGAYSYQVYAFNASGSSVLSNLAAVAAPPLAPNSLTAVYQSGVLLTWNDNSLAETGFIVERSIDSGVTFNQIAALGPLTTGSGVGNVSYLDVSVSPLGVYVYRVAAENAAGLSDYSADASITLPDFPPAPVLGTITNANRKITVTWASVPVATGYTIQWSTDITFATQVGSGTAKANATSFTTPNLTRGNTYYFRIRAESATGPSLWAYYSPFTLP